MNTWKLNVCKACGFHGFGFRYQSRRRCPCHRFYLSRLRMMCSFTSLQDISFFLFLFMKIFVVLGVQDQRTNSPHFIPDVWYTKLIDCDCDFVYNGQTDRASATRVKAGTQRAARVCDNDSKIEQHTNQFGHSMDLTITLS